MKPVAKTPLKIWSQAMILGFVFLLSAYLVIWLMSWLTNDEMPTFWTLLKFIKWTVVTMIIFLIREYYVRNRITGMEEKGEATEKIVLEKGKAETEFLTGYGIFMAILILVGGLAITILFLIAYSL